ncbi:MAG: DUF4833 domain-containing protein [Myxococcota bacterium]
MTLSLVLAVLAADPPACPAELFRIERSKNANVVLYETKQAGKGELDAKEPVTATWLMLADKGQREPLTFLERRLAYGFDVAASKEGIEVLLKALATRRILVRKSGACHAAVATIDGRDAVLRRIYVRSDESALMPEVLSIELFGADERTGEARYEKLLPAK